MTKEELKRQVCADLDAHRDELIRSGEALLRMPELAYREYRTSDFAGKWFARLGLKQRSGLAVTGRRADVSCGRPGPRVAVLGELDALIVPAHPFADPVTHAAHACGHHANLNAMLGCALALAKPEVLKHLAGELAFVAAPSEECQDQPYIAKLIEGGKLRFFGGKSELIAEGVFDDVDAALMLHAGGSNYTPSGFNGFVMKKLVFHGRSAHAGAHPEEGVNAVSMMRSALALVDAQRDTFRDEDRVRIHGYIPEGGEAVNVVPDRAVYVVQVRAATPEAVRGASGKVDRCVRAAAVAFGGTAEVCNLFGFMPLVPYAALDGIHEENARSIAPEAPFERGIFRPSSTDMGDVSMIMPALHAYFRGFSGTAHTGDFLAADPVQAYVEPAKMLALDAIDLLWGDGSRAAGIAEAKPPLTRAEYLERMRGFSSRKVFCD